MERSFNRPYMWPLIPFDLKALLGIIIRTPVLHNRDAPNYLKPQQRDRMPNGEESTDSRFAKNANEMWN